MVGESIRDRSVFFPAGDDKGLPPIAVADDHLGSEKMNKLGGVGNKVNRRKQASAEVDKVSNKDQAAPKKTRFIWTRNVHNCFLDAIEQIGFHRAVPTRILDLMKVEDLTRENVASHLQKYRLQVKRREKERRARAASENVPKGVYPHMSGIPQQPWVLPNTMQGRNMECACLDRSQLALSFPDPNLNMIQAFPTVQEVYGTPFKDLLDEGVNRMSSSRLVHGLYDSNGPYDINRIGYNYGLLPPKPLVDSHAHNLMDRRDTTLVPQYDWRDELSLQGIISPPFVPQYDRRDELSLQGFISPSFVPQYDQRDELSLQGIINPLFVPQYGRRDELFVADQGIISPSLAQNTEGLGVGMPQLPTGGFAGMKVEGIGLGMSQPPTGGFARMKVEGIGLGMSQPPTGGFAGMKVEGIGLGVSLLPEATGCLGGMKVKGHVPRLPEATGGLARMRVQGHVPLLPEATEGLAGMKGEGHVPLLSEATGGLAGMKVEGHGLGVPCLPEANGGMKFEGLGVGATHLPEATGGLGVGVPCPPEASGGLAEMNDFELGYSLDEEQESVLDFSDVWMNMKGEDVDGKSFDDLFQR